MALIFCDSFDHYATADLLAKYTLQNSTVTIAASGRFGSGLVCQGGNGRYMARDIPAQTTYIAGFALKFSSSLNGTGVMFAFRESGTTHVDLRIDSGRHLFVTRNGTSLGSLGLTSLVPNAWYYIEIKVTINDTTGIVVVKINGVEEINLTSQDTRNAGSGVINQFAIGTVSTNNNFDPIFDDLYIADATGSSPTNDFLGDVRVEALFPNGNGNSSQFTGSDGNSTDNYLLVDETTPNGDTDYVEDLTVGDKDTYTFTNLTPTSGTVYGVQIIPSAKKTDAGTRQITNVARLSTTEVDSASAYNLSTAYQYYPEIREAKPGGGTWSISDVNSAEFGFKVA